MSTIASPRQSLTIASRRDSTSTDNTTRSVSTSRVPAVSSNARRNRAALREFYGLKTSQQDSGTASPVPAIETGEESELDREGFDAEQYVNDLLANESLESILRVEASLISETRNLDGEKKALVYDNYSKLIAATQTIQKMQASMALSPTTATVTPAINHIAETATALSQSLKRQHIPAEQHGSRKMAERQTVRWVLAAPQRISHLVETGETESAGLQWTEVKSLLDKWEGVAGVDEVRQACLSALSKHQT